MDKNDEYDFDICEKYLRQLMSEVFYISISCFAYKHEDREAMSGKIIRINEITSHIVKEFNLSLTILSERFPRYTRSLDHELADVIDSLTTSCNSIIYVYKLRDKCSIKNFKRNLQYELSVISTDIKKIGEIYEVNSKE